LPHPGAVRRNSGAGYNFNWKNLSAVVGITFLSFYFRWYARSVKAPQVIDFLQALQRCIPRPLTVIWDGLPAHRSRMVRNYLQTLNGRIRTEFLPSYAPELNPVEYIWAYWKQHELPNVCPKDYWQLSEAARRTLKRMRRRTRVMAAFWKQASLWTAGTILCGT
jgi:transposase